MSVNMNLMKQSLYEYAMMTGQEIKRVDSSAEEPEEAKKAKEKLKDWMNSPEYEVWLSEEGKRRASAERLTFHEPTPEEQERFKNQYVTEYLGFTTNKYGYAAEMEAAGDVFNKNVGTDKIDKALESLDTKYSEISERIKSEYTGSEADERMAELKDNYRAMLTDFTNRLVETNGRTRGQVDSLVKWNQFVPTKERHEADTDALYERLDESDQILSGLSDMIRDFDPENDISGVKDALRKYVATETAVEDIVFTARGLDPDEIRNRWYEENGYRKSNVISVMGEADSPDVPGVADNPETEVEKSDSVEIHVSKHDTQMTARNILQSIMQEYMSRQKAAAKVTI